MVYNRRAGKALPQNALIEFLEPNLFAKQISLDKKIKNCFQL